MNVAVSLPQGFPQWKTRGGRWEEGNPFSLFPSYLNTNRLLWRRKRTGVRKAKDPKYLKNKVIRRGIVFSF